MWMRVGFGVAERSLRRRLSLDRDRVCDLERDWLDFLFSRLPRLRDTDRDLRLSFSSFGFSSFMGFLSFLLPSLTGALSAALSPLAGLFLSATFLGLARFSPPLLDDDDELELLLLLELDELEDELREELLSDELQW